MTDRGVSVTVNYVLGLVIATLLMTGLIWTAGDVVEDRRESVALGEMRVVGQQVVAELMTADRLAQTGAGTVVVRVEGPDDVAGHSYSVSLDATTDEVVVMTTDSTIEVRVPFDTRTAVSTSTADGGDVEVALTGAGDLEVREA